MLNHFTKALLFVESLLFLIAKKLNSPANRVGY
jgi:hypothetical protein